jgi:hypothetical protein
MSTNEEPEIVIFRVADLLSRGIMTPEETFHHTCDTIFWMARCNDHLVERLLRLIHERFPESVISLWAEHIAFHPTSERGWAWNYADPFLSAVPWGDSNNDLLDTRTRGLKEEDHWADAQEHLFVEADIWRRLFGHGGVERFSESFDRDVRRDKLADRESSFEIWNSSPESNIRHNVKMARHDQRLLDALRRGGKLQLDNQLPGAFLADIQKQFWRVRHDSERLLSLARLVVEQASPCHLMRIDEHYSTMPTTPRGWARFRITSPVLWASESITDVIGPGKAFACYEEFSSRMRINQLWTYDCTMAWRKAKAEVTTHH